MAEVLFSTITCAFLIGALVKVKTEIEAKAHIITLQPIWRYLLNLFYRRIGN